MAPRGNRTPPPRRAGNDSGAKTAFTGLRANRSPREGVLKVWPSISLFPVSGPAVVPAEADAAVRSPRIPEEVPHPTAAARRVRMVLQRLAVRYNFGRATLHEF